MRSHEPVWRIIATSLLNGNLCCGQMVDNFEDRLQRLEFSL